MSMSAAPRTPVFISYSNIDKVWRDRIFSVLASFGLEVLDDTLLHPGQIWAAELKTMRESSGVAILIVTPHFLASDTIRKEELPHILELQRSQGLRIIPVIAESSAWQTFEPFKNIQVFPEGGRPLFKGSDEQIRGDLEKLGQEIISIAAEHTE